MTASALSLETLTACVHAHLPHPVTPIFSPIPTGKFNTSYFVRLDEKEYVLRIAPPQDAVFVFYERDMMRQEPGIHALLLSKTSVPVADIIAFDDSQTLMPRNFLIMERLPGEPMSASFVQNHNVVLREVGEALAQTHHLTAEQFGYLGEHAPMPPQSSWNDAFAVMWRKLIKDVAAVGYYSQEERTWLLKLFETYRGVFDRQVPASLLHMDVWGQNILVDDAGHLSGLVDWDRALWGDPEIEFAVLDYCGISQPAFWEGYGQPRDHSNAAQIRSLFYLLYELQKYIVIRHGRSHDPVSARRYKQQVIQLVQRYF